MIEKKYIIGIDGGGTNTVGVLFDQKGQTIYRIVSSGSNLSIYKSLAINRINKIIQKLTEFSKINLEDLSAVGIGVAGISDLNQRELLIKELDRLKIADKTLVTSDLEAAYRLICPTNQGVFISIGTGIVGMGRSKDKVIKVAGKGHENGDLGSGYWMGKQVIKNLLLNFNIIDVDDDLSNIYKMVKENLKISDYESLNKFLIENENVICDVASLAPGLIEIAESGNDLALSIIQEATTYVADYLIYMFDNLNFDKKDVIIGCNGSVVKNKFYRKLLSEALQFEFENLHWIFSDLSAAYGAGLIASAYKNINVSIQDLNNNNN